MNGGFALLFFIGPALDRTMVQRSNLVHLESDVRAIEMSVVLHLYVCPFVSELGERNLYLYETPNAF